jgi:putative ABC transport system permease protein
VVGVVTTTSWMVAPAPGDDQFDAVYIPFSTVHRLLNLAKLTTLPLRPPERCRGSWAT